MNKKGFSLIKYPIAILLFSLVVYGWFSVVSDTSSDSFWKEQGYTIPSSSNMSRWNKIDEMGQESENIACDLNPESEACAEITGTDKTGIEKIVGGGYGALVTLYKLFGVPKTLIIEVLGEIGVPEIFSQVFYYTLLFAVVLTIVFIVFNRSDTL